MRSLSIEAVDIYDQYVSTGDLEDNETLVRELLYYFTDLASMYSGIKKYQLFFRDANEERYRFENIVRSRYGEI